MTCDRRLLSLFRDGELDPEQRRAVDRHLLECRECSAAFHGYLRLGQVIRSLPSQAVPPSLERDVRRRIAEREAARRSRVGLGGLMPAIVPAVAAAAAALAVLVVVRPGAVELPGRAPAAEPVATRPGGGQTVSTPTAPAAVAQAPVVAAPSYDRMSSSGGGTRINGADRVGGLPSAIGRLYRGDDDIRARLGQPAQGSKTLTLIEQSFQGGLAVWRGDTREIYVLRRVGRSGGTWAVYPDTWRPGVTVIAGAAPPPGAMAPVGGFGTLWQSRPEVQSWLGWAVYEPRGSGGAIQQFEHGLIIWSPHGLLYVLSNDGTWKTYPDATPV